MKYIGIIPARLESKRFPQKLLENILGKSLIQRTYENALLCSDLDDIYVATDSEIISDYAKQFSAKVIKTKACDNGTIRAAEAVKSLNGIDPNDIIVNIQGDHPCIFPTTISALLKPFEDNKIIITTPLIKVTNYAQIESSNIVKCVFDKNGKALYFSRSVIPNNKDVFYQHLGIYAYRKHFLLEIQKLPNTPLQLQEDLEQLKILEHGYSIQTVIVNDVDIAIDIPKDVNKLERYLCKQNTFS
jgi:3-deoxy-manno-octulosonate cytidylyltransferase (CMP-KDO synthetase)